MEIYMDKIIQADKKACRIIELAQKERDKILKKSLVDANKDLEFRKQAQLKTMASQDKKIKSDEIVEMERADKEYIIAKHKMDKVFNDGIDTWGDEIIAAVLK